MFTSTSGLQINNQKSMMVVVRVSNQKKTQELIGFNEGKLPFRYLGVPITVGRLSSSDCQLLVDKIMAKFQIWGTKNLSYTGKSVLINSVLMGIYGFWASNFILPK